MKGEDMKTLDLVVKDWWYDAIDLCGKKEEYREATPYWKHKLMNADESYKHFDAIRFHRGYTKRSMTFEHTSTSYGQGKQEWGAPDHDTYIIGLGRRLSKQQFK